MNEKSAIILLPVDVLFFVLGFIITFSTSSTLNRMNNIITITFLIISTIQIFSFFYNEEHKKQNYLNLSLGIVSLWMAIFTLNNYGLFISLLPSITVLYCIVYGLDAAKKYYQDKSKANTITLIVLTLIAIILLAQPMALLNIKVAGITYILLALYTFVPKILLISEAQKTT